MRAVSANLVHSHGVTQLVVSEPCNYVVCDISVSKFELIEGGVFKPAPLWKLQWPAILGAMGLGFCLSLLFFMDHNIAGAIVNSADNRYGAGPA